MQVHQNPEIYHSISFAKPEQNSFDAGYKQLRNSSMRFQQSFCSENCMSEKESQSLEQNVWRPKLPTKKLMQDPKFLFSVSKKKVRALNSESYFEFEAPKSENKSFRQSKIRTKKPLFSDKNQNNDQTERKLETRTKSPIKNLRIPISNFNLHHLLEKRKSFRSQEESVKKGSNLPYYSFVSSQRFDSKRVGQNELMQGQKRQRSLILRKTLQVSTVANFNVKRHNNLIL